MRCDECNKELQVNNNYTIESITCGECWANGDGYRHQANPKDVYYTQPSNDEWTN